MRKDEKSCYRKRDLVVKSRAIPDSKFFFILKKKENPPYSE